MPLSFLVAFAFADTGFPLPPYRRLDTATVAAEGYRTSVDVLGNTFFAAVGDCVAYDLTTLKRKWAAHMPKGERAETVAAANGVVYVLTAPDYRKTQAHLVALDAASGKQRWSMPRTGDPGQAAIVGNLLFTGLKPNTRSAVDLTRHKARWTASLAASGGEMERGEVGAIAATPRDVVANVGQTTYGIDVATGKVLWREPNSYVLEGGLVIAGNTAWVPSGNGSVGRDLTSGKVLWTSPTLNYSDFGAVFAGNFVGIDNGVLHAIEPRTGHTLWSVDVGDRSTSGGNQWGAVFGKWLFVRGLKKTVIVDPQGKTIWSAASEEGYPAPVWAAGGKLVAFDGRRLIRYERGEAPQLPADSASRQKLAQSMVARFDKLDDHDVKQLESLGDDAFEPVLAAFLNACAAYDAKKDNAGMDLYDRYHSLGEVLMKVTTKARIQDLMAALDKVPKESTSKPMLLTLLAQYGDPAVVTPYFLREISGVKTPGFEMYESNTYVAREFVINSKDPRAVAFLMDQLKNPKADDTLRFEAYVHLAGTGGEEGVKAVLAERTKRALLRPLSERVLSGYLNAGEFGTRTKPFAEKKDAQGHEWALLTSGVIGSSGDLWLAEKVNGNWDNPLFTGVSREGPSRWAKPTPPEPTIAGKTGQQLAATDWLSLLAHNEEIRRDTDGDGLTDLVEQRLGTDAKNKDTDGDGDADNVDPWPNAPQRPISDAEQVLAAAFEARYHFDDSEGVGLFFAEPGMKPFEMAGRKGPMIWVPAGGNQWSQPLEQRYEQGVAFIRFGDMSQDEKKPWEERVIKWNGDHTEARVSISTYFGGLNGTGYDVVVRKFGNDWVVTFMRMAYVS